MKSCMDKNVRAKIMLEARSCINYFCDEGLSFSFVKLSDCGKSEVLRLGVCRMLNLSASDLSLASQFSLTPSGKKQKHPSKKVVVHVYFGVRTSQPGSLDHKSKIDS